MLDDDRRTIDCMRRVEELENNIAVFRFVFHWIHTKSAVLGGLDEKDFRLTTGASVRDLQSYPFGVQLCVERFTKSGLYGFLVAHLTECRLVDSTQLQDGIGLEWRTVDAGKG